MSNPFAVRPSNGRPHSPLRPWSELADTEYYVPVDATQQQFDKFTAELPDPADLIGNGRLVLVTGNKGCGKTSLAHRCAHWASEELAKQQIRGEVVDLTPEALPRTATAEHRMQQICHRLIDDLLMANCLPEGARVTLAPVQEQPNYAYPLFRGLLAEPSTVAIVILPPSDDLSEEVIEYARLARGRILFLAESTYPEVAVACKASQPMVPVIYLTVGPLRTEDGWLFAENRLRQHGRADTPRIDPATVQLIVQKWPEQISVKGLELILFRVYQKAISESVKEISFHYVTECWFGQTGNFENWNG